MAKKESREIIDKEIAKKKIEKEMKEEQEDAAYREVADKIN